MTLGYIKRRGYLKSVFLTSLNLFTLFIDTSISYSVESLTCSPSPGETLSPPIFCEDPSDKKNLLFCSFTFSSLYWENVDQTTHIPMVTDTTCSSREFPGLMMSQVPFGFLLSDSKWNWCVASLGSRCTQLSRTASRGQMAYRTAPYCRGYLGAREELGW